MSNNSSLADADDGYTYILLFRLIVWGYAGIVLSVFGIVGNLITILVLISPSMRTTSTNIYLTALSGSNILFLLIFIPSYSMKYLIGYRLYMNNQPTFALEILLARLPTTPIYSTILLSIIYLTVAVSTDRLILIKFPLKAKHILTPRTTLVAILCIYIFSIVYCIPYWLEQEYNPEQKRCQLTSIGKRIHKYTRIYIYIPVVNLIPFITLTCINITIIQYLMAQERRKKSLGAKTTKKKQADHYITLMLVAMIIVFVLCEGPLLVLNAWYAIDPAGSSGSILFHSLNSIGVLLIVFKSSTNFLLYCFFGQKFRQTLLKFIFHFIPHRRKASIEQPRRSYQPQVSSLLTSLPITIPKRTMSSGHSSSTTTADDLKVPKTPTRQLEIQPLNGNSTATSTLIANVHEEESSPLLSKSEETVPTSQSVQIKAEYQPNLYTCANGKRILVLRI